MGKLITTILITAALSITATPAEAKQKNPRPDAPVICSTC